MFVLQCFGVDPNLELGVHVDHIMNSLSRREEETLLKTTKSYAFRECDDVVKGRFHGIMILLTDSCPNSFCGLRVWSDYFCCLGMSRKVTRSPRMYDSVVRTYCFSLWSTSYLCPSTGPEPMERVRQEYLRLRASPTLGHAYH
jgi:hypothetical protein